MDDLVTGELSDRTGLTRLQAMTVGEREAVLLGCCASNRWAAAVAARLDSCQTTPELLQLADQSWWKLGPDDWREALNAHPKIGERTAAGSREGHEQGSMSSAGPAVREAIAENNRAYEQRFGMTYVIRAAGRSPPEMLLMLRRRLDNQPTAEIRVAATQQAEITRLRLKSVLSELAAA